VGPSGDQSTQELLKEFCFEVEAHGIAGTELKREGKEGGREGGMRHVERFGWNGSMQKAATSKHRPSDTLTKHSHSFFASSLIHAWMHYLPANYVQKNFRPYCVGHRRQML
jgi:hypothetical protein